MTPLTQVGPASDDAFDEKIEGNLKVNKGKE
jgi:hypothetical protein